MTQAERDRLVALRKAKKKLITQQEAAQELGVTERHVRRLLRELKKRPVACYTDKASLFQTAVKTKRDEQREGQDRPEMPPTQIARALQELGIAWIAAHSPQAKGRVERGFSTAQDRLVKSMRVAGVATLQQANQYLEQEFLPWCNETLAVAPANPDDTHRPLDKHHAPRRFYCRLLSWPISDALALPTAAPACAEASHETPAGIGVAPA
jgi:predicted transcriptional regulator